MCICLLKAKTIFQGSTIIRKLKAAVLIFSFFNIFTKLIHVLNNLIQCKFGETAENVSVVAKYRYSIFMVVLQVQRRHPVMQFIFEHGGGSTSAEPSTVGALEVHCCCNWGCHSVAPPRGFLLVIFLCLSPKLVKRS